MADLGSVEYRDAVLSAMYVAQLLTIHDLPGLLAAIEKAHAIAPVTNPTLYREKAKAMQEDAELLKAAMPLWNIGKKLIEARNAR